MVEKTEGVELEPVSLAAGVVGASGSTGEGMLEEAATETGGEGDGAPIT